MTNATLLKVQIGPVQEFISQARTTRDLWSGSYLLSWMMANAILAVRQADSNAEFVFPSLSTQPLIEFLEMGKNGDAEAILTPNLPNLFLTVLQKGESEAKDIGRAVEGLFDLRRDSEWKRICDHCRDYLHSEGPGLSAWQKERWTFQMANFWQVTWQVWPELPAGSDLSDKARTIPLLNNRSRTYSPTSDGWEENYQIISHRLDARRQTRDFFAWERVECAPADHAGGRAEKDNFSGKEEAVVDTNWIGRAHCKACGFAFLFRSNDALGAPNLVKRVWHKAYLEKTHGLSRRALVFESTPEVAAAPFRKRLIEGLKNTREDFEAVRELQEAVYRAKDLLPDEEVAKNIPNPSDRNTEQWIANADPVVFNESTWALDEFNSNEDERHRARRVLAAHDDVRKKLGLAEPGRYYAVIAMDGDEMGKWVSGEKTGGMSRGFHKNFSLALSEFALRQAREVVERHNGRLIFSGGDDVLALVPATEALDCAKNLLEQFSATQFESKGDFSLTASAGIAIGHIKAPLQDMIGAAQEAERLAKRSSEWNEAEWNEEHDPWDWPMGLTPEARRREEQAKKVPRERGFGRDAIAVTLYKRSGEMVQWGARRLARGNELSTAWELLNLIQRHSRLPIDQPKTVMPISGRFAHRLAELLRPLGDNVFVNDKSKQIILNEFKHIVTRQVREGLGAESKEAALELRTELNRLASEFLDELTAQRAPLDWFLNLFLTESFVARQGD